MPALLQLNVVKSLPSEAKGFALFSVIRDEDYLLPHFFDHYRRLGVERFLIYDDRSGPGTVDFLMGQPDAAILRSNFSFGDKLEGTERADGEPRRVQSLLKTQAPELLLQGQWVVHVDADEFLLPPAAFSTLPDFVRHLDEIGQPYATAPLVDFYGETLADRNYDRSLSPFAGCPYFDAGPYYFWIGADYPICFSGGVRQRLLERLCATHPDRAPAIYGARFPSPARFWKAPLLKHGAGVTRIDEHTFSVPPRIGGMAAALAHFKFSPDLDAKIDVALKERQYYGGSVEYAFLKTSIELFGHAPLASPQTRRFEGAESLEAAGLLTPAQIGLKQT